MHPKLRLQHRRPSLQEESHGNTARSRAAKSWAVQRPRPCACSIGIPRCKRRGAARQHGVGTAKSWGCSKTPPLSQEIGLHSPPNLHTAHTKAHAYQEAKKCDLGIVPHDRLLDARTPLHGDHSKGTSTGSMQEPTPALPQGQETYGQCLEQLATDARTT